MEINPPLWFGHVLGCTNNVWRGSSCKVRPLEQVVLNFSNHGDPYFKDTDLVLLICGYGIRQTDGRRCLYI